MNFGALNSAIARRLPLLAALVVLGLNGSVHVDGAAIAAPYMDRSSLFASAGAQDSASVSALKPLSPKDEALYKTAFGAQEKGDQGLVSEAVSKIEDKRLLGHLLADRYLRVGATLDEARIWMAQYADFPEASDVYGKVSRLKGFAKAGIPRPKATAAYFGSVEVNSSTGFKNTEDTPKDAVRKSIDSRINAELRRGFSVRARSILGEELNKGSLSITSASDIVGSIAASFFYQGDDVRAMETARLAVDAKEPLALWIQGLSAWRQKDFASAAKAFSALGENDSLSSWDAAAASYWAYRATSRVGDKTQSYRWLSKAASYRRSFYGYMAASLMGRAPEYLWDMPKLSDKYASLLTSNPYGWRALALVQIGRNDLAEGELRRLSANRTKDKDLRRAALALAERAKMTALTMQLGGVVRNDEGKLFDAALYPVPPWKPAKGFKVERALLYALMRRESQFDPEAVSARGACGLMQVMPATARQMAEGHKEKTGISTSNCSSMLFDPEINIDIGQRYMQTLASQPNIGDNLLLLLAAYNGGPGNLARWLDGSSKNDPILFMETLPSRETRDYMQQVLLHYWGYRSRLSAPEFAATDLAHGEWPRYSLYDTENAKFAEVR